MFTVNQIKALQPKKSAYYVFEPGERGSGSLGIQVAASASKRFYFRYYANKKPRFILLGVFPTLSLTNARMKAQALSLQVKDGLDPKEEIAQASKLAIEAKRLEEQQGTIKQLFHSYTQTMARDGKRTHKAVLAALEKEVYPHIKPETKAASVSTQDIIILLAAMLKRGAGTQANRVRSYIMAAFSHGLKHDNDPLSFSQSSAMFGIKFNPVAGIPKQNSLERVRDRYLSWNELKQVLSHFQLTPKVGAMPNLLLKLCGFTPPWRTIS